MSGGKCVPWHISACNLRASPFLLVIWMRTCSPNSYHSCFPQVIRSYAGQPRSNEVNDLCRSFRVPLLSKVIWGADFNADIHFTLRWRSEVMEKPGHQRSMTLCDPQIFFEFLTPKNHPRAIKNHRNVSTRREKHAGRRNFALAPSEAKLLAITGFRDFSALDLTPEVTGWPRTLSLYTNRFVS